MFRLLYVKTDAGTVVVSADKFDANRQVQDVFERFENFFQDVPTWGGREWQTLPAEEIAQFFCQVAAAFVQYYEGLRTQQQQEHQRRWPLVKLFRWVRGWKPIEVPTKEAMIASIQQRCESLADWMDENKHRPFYAGSDMSCYIVKPREVAKLLG